VDWLTGVVAAERKISDPDLTLFHVTDDPDEVLKIVRETRAAKPRAVRRERRKGDRPIVGEQPSTPEAEPAPAKRAD
jgi:hypothetical protein